MNLESSETAKKLTRLLEASPQKAERFTIENGFDIDALLFEDRPFEGVSSIITNGVSGYCENKTFEFILSFSPESLSKDVDLFAFIATYLQLHFLPNHREITSGDNFSINGNIIKGLNFNGIWATEPRYFPVGIFDEIFDVEFLWLVPTYDSEARYIKSQGLEAFESHLHEVDPDLTLFNRLPLGL